MIAQYNHIPIYRASVDGEDTGMVVVSLVDAPAIESDFLAFSKVEEVRLSIQDEEQRKVLGAVMVPGKLIYREMSDGTPYYLSFDADTIHKMAERYFQSQNVNNVDTDHSFELVDGVTLTQAFYKNEAKGINPAGFEDLPNDTLFFEYHITNDEIWDGVKDGTWKGFSLAGTFDIEPVQLSKKNILDDIQDMLNKLQNRLK